jgi:hypothetical protein
MTLEDAQRRIGGTPARRVVLPFGAEDEGALHMFDDIGVTLVTKGGRVEAVLARDVYLGQLVRGGTLGSARHEIEARYGRPAQEDGTPERAIWVYPSLRLVMRFRADRVTGWWVY